MGTFTVEQEKQSLDLFIYPNNDLIGCIDWTPVGDTPNYKCIDETKNLPDDDVTYVHWENISSGIDMYSLPSGTDITGIINYIQVYARAKSHQFSQSPSGIFKLICSPNSICGTLFKSNDRNLTTNYQIYTFIWTQNPSTATTWTLNDIRNLSIGIEATSPTRDGVAGEDIYIPNAGGSSNENQTMDDGGLGDPSSNNYQWIDDESTSTSITCQHQIVYYLDLYNIPNHLTENVYSYTKVTVWGYCKKGGEVGNDQRLRLACKSGASTYYGSSESMFYPESTWFSKEWTTNPAGGAWNDASIDALEIGIELHRGGPVSATHCMRLFAKVEYLLNVNPEIRVTQCFLRVNYTPPEDSCTLNKPEDISVNHSENIKMLNFWDGTREVYSLNRSGKSIVLTGSEYQSDTCNSMCPCERITCINNMGKDGSTITISGLRSLFNGDYKIRSFGWKHISKKPENYEWILELEYDD